MKKLTPILILILVATFVALSILGQGSEYNAEKLYYKAMKSYSVVAMNPDVVPPKIITSVEKRLKEIVEKFSSGNTAKNAHFKLAELYLTRKECDLAISTGDEIIAKYGDDIVLASKAQFLKAVSYEVKDEWSKAYKELKILQDKYIETTLGLQVPLYIAGHYRKEGNNEEAVRATTEAKAFYAQMMEENKGALLGYASSVMLLQTLVNLREHKEAGDLLEGIISEYDNPVIVTQLLPYVEVIFEKVLNEPERAIKIYKSLKEAIQDKRAISLLEAKIKSLTGEVE